MSNLLILDFDGVIMNDYQELYPQIPDLIKELSKHYVLAIASFNRRVKILLKKWKLDSYFLAIRSRTNFEWNYSHHEILTLFGLSKTKQIKSMLKNELQNKNFDDIYFFDDNVYNIYKVRLKNPNIKSILVDKGVGLTKDNLIGLI
jgi:hypothetical protein